MSCRLRSSLATLREFKAKYFAEIIQLTWQIRLQSKVTIRIVSFSVLHFFEVSVPQSEELFNFTAENFIQDMKNRLEGGSFSQVKMLDCSVIIPQLQMTCVP